MDNHSICIDCRKWGRQHAGIGRYTQEIVQYLLLHKNWNFTLLTNECSDDELREFIKINSLNNVKLNKCTSGIFSVKAQFELVSKIPVCDILWIPSINIPLFPTRAKKLITTIHDVFHLAYPEYYSKLKFLIIKSLISKAVSNSSLILTVSDFSVDEIARFYGNKVKNKIERVYNGFNDVIYEKKAVFTERFNYLLFVGSVKPHKNLKNALLAFEKGMKENNNLRFVIVGKKEGFVTGDNEVSEIVNRINQSSESVIFTGNVDDDTLYTIYADATALIMPSYYEGFGLPLIEAMHFQLPIICSDIPVFHEVCGDQVLYFDPQDIDSISQRIKEVSHMNHKIYLRWQNWSEVGEQVAKILEKQF